MKNSDTVQVKPYYIENSKGKATHVYLSYEAYQAILRELKVYDKLKAKGIRWVSVEKDKKRI